MAPSRLPPRPITRRSRTSRTASTSASTWTSAAPSPRSSASSASTPNIDFDGIIPAIVAGGQADAGLSGISITPEREDQVDFSEPYYVDNQAVAVMADNADITEDNAAEALNQEGVKIAVQSGSTGESFAAENFPNARARLVPQLHRRLRRG